jgi:hypothetical protein
MNLELTKNEIKIIIRSLGENHESLNNSINVIVKNSIDPRPILNTLYELEGLQKKLKNKIME